MNHNLMKAIGVNIKAKKSGGAQNYNSHEVTIYRSRVKDRRYSISVRPDIAKRLGEAVFVSEPWQDRLLFFPASKKDKNARWLSGKSSSKGSRKIITITASKDDDLEQFCGNYDLKWWPEMEGYYISTSNPFRSVKEATA